MGGHFSWTTVAGNRRDDETGADCKCQKQRGRIPADGKYGQGLRCGVGL
jgi:hypothetical protein